MVVMTVVRVMLVRVRAEVDLETSEECFKFLAIGHLLEMSLLSLPHRA